MENKSIELQIRRDEDGFVYVFESKEKVQIQTKEKFKTKIWQLIPSVCGSLLCVPFGMMLGWPSPSYPTFLDEKISPIPITMDQSAMIAGFLMIGNSLGTPFSTKTLFGPKYGIFTGTSLMSIGWILMWQARDIYWLLGSRVILGIGHGFGMGQLRNYIHGMCDGSLATTLVKQTMLYICLGVILICSYGAFVNVAQMAVISLIITVLILFLTIFLPSTPKELVRKEKVEDAIKLIHFLKPRANIREEIDKIRQEIEKFPEAISLFNIMKINSHRKSFAIFCTLVILQQFTGIPATIIYSQILFRESHVPFPEYCAILYSVVYFITNIYGIFISPTYNKRNVLLFSSITLSIVIVIKILVLVFNVNDAFWNFTSVIVMILYLSIHTIGLGNIPVTLIDDLFPRNCKQTMILSFVIIHSITALIITKIFQVLLDKYDLYIPFCLFLFFSCFSIIVIYFGLPAKTKMEKVIQTQKFNSIF